MKSFEEWTREIAEYINKPEEPDYSDIPEELIDGGVEDENAEGGWLYPCRCCGDLSPIYCEPHEWSSNMHYCGKSERCLP